MKIVPRHQLSGDRGGLAASIKKNGDLLAKHVSSESWDASDTAILSSMAFDNAARRAWFDPSDCAILSDLELSACTAAAAHAAATTAGLEPLKAPAPGGRWITVTRTQEGPPKRFDPPTQWRHGLLAARIARNRDAIDMLASVRVDRLIDLSTTPPPSWFASEAAALAATFRLDSSAGDLLVEAMRHTDPDRVENVSRNWVLDVIVPEIETAFRALQHDQDAFARAMQQALDGHHHFYGNEGEGHFHGQLAVAPLAMACLGYDLGLRMTVESDYTPGWIVERVDP
jgi:hypothetical protein